MALDSFTDVDSFHILVHVLFIFKNYFLDKFLSRYRLCRPQSMKLQKLTEKKPALE